MLRHQSADQAENHELPEDVVLCELTVLYPNEKPSRTLRTVIGWARYAELFNYDSTRKVFYPMPARKSEVQTKPEAKPG